jgi:hypothetical protein
VKRFYHNGLFRRVDKKQDPGPVRGGRVYGLVDCPKVDDKPALAPLMKELVEAIGKARENLPKVVEKMKAVPRWKGRLDLDPRGFVCERLDAATGFVPPFDGANKKMKLEVLWPCASGTGADGSYPFYKDAGKTVNGNSVVLRVSYGTKNILLTGDLNEFAMDELRQKYPSPGPGAPSPLRADVYKAAHHGSQHFSVTFLEAVSPDAGVISSGDDKDDEYGHPRAVLLGTITHSSKCARPAVFCTELAACFSKLPRAGQEKFEKYKGQLYERSIRGVVLLRSDGERLMLGTVHGRKAPDDPLAGVVWKWDIWPDVKQQGDE